MSSNDLTHLNPDGSARMVNVGDKAITSRKAVAEGFVRASSELLTRIASDQIAKGNVLQVARLAGIQAAKRTDELIPLCHSLPLDGVQVDLILKQDGISIRAEASTTWKTGVEMEALTAVSVAALTLIDMGKAVDKTMTIEHIRLVEKIGGKSGTFSAQPLPEKKQQPHIRIAILTLSDRCSRGETQDTSGPALAQLAIDRLNANIVMRDCIPDDHTTIAQTLIRWADVDPKPDLILTTGGTGLSPRDVTPEATLQILQRRHPGIVELIHKRCYEKTPLTYLSRGEAGTRGQTLIVNLPGSHKGAVESLEAILDILPHAIAILQNAPHE